MAMLDPASPPNLRIRLPERPSCWPVEAATGDMAELKRHRGGDFAAAEELWRGRAMRKPRETAAFRI